jgi:hypothetical protein
VVPNKGRTGSVGGQVERISATYPQALPTYNYTPFEGFGKIPYLSANPPKLPRGSLHRSTTPSTLPGVSQPRNSSSNLTQASRGPSATISTRPSSAFLAHPLNPSSRARARVHQRNPTPCTRPRTQAVSLVPLFSLSSLSVIIRRLLSVVLSLAIALPLKRWSPAVRRPPWGRPHHSPDRRLRALRRLLTVYLLVARALVNAHRRT